MRIRNIKESETETCELSFGIGTTIRELTRAIPQRIKNRRLSCDRLRLATARMKATPPAAVTSLWNDVKNRFSMFPALDIASVWLKVRVILPFTKTDRGRMRLLLTN